MVNGTSKAITCRQKMGGEAALEQLLISITQRILPSFTGSSHLRRYVADLMITCPVLHCKPYLYTISPI